MAWHASRLVVLAVGQLLALAITWRFFVRTARGQLLDTIALAGSKIGSSRVGAPLQQVLDAVPAVAAATTLGAVVFLVLRRRFLLAAVVAGLVVGANVTTQVLKAVIDRPYLFVDVERAAAGNSLPSGHATVAASVAVALVLALPPRMRGLGALLGAGYAALTGIATVVAGWHRPSDVAAAYLVVGIWAATGGVVLALFSRSGMPRARLTYPITVAVLGVIGFGLLVVTAAGVALTGQVLDVPVEELSRTRLFIAYASGACGIAGTASVIMATVLAVPTDGASNMSPPRPISRRRYGVAWSGRYGVASPGPFDTASRVPAGALLRGPTRADGIRDRARLS